MPKLNLHRKRAKTPTKATRRTRPKDAILGGRLTGYSVFLSVFHYKLNQDASHKKVKISKPPLTFLSRYIGEAWKAADPKTKALFTEIALTMNQQRFSISDAHPYDAEHDHPNFMVFKFLGISSATYESLTTHPVQLPTMTTAPPATTVSSTLDRQQATGSTQSSSRYAPPRNISSKCFPATTEPGDSIASAITGEAQASVTIPPLRSNHRLAPLPSLGLALGTLPEGPQYSNMIYGSTNPPPSIQAQGVEPSFAPAPTLPSNFQEPPGSDPPAKYPIPDMSGYVVEAGGSFTGFEDIGPRFLHFGGEEGLSGGSWFTDV